MKSTSEQNASSQNLFIEAEVCPAVNQASFQNSVPLLRRLTIKNPSPGTYCNLQLKLQSEPVFLQPKTWHIERIDPRTEFTLTDLDVSLDHAYLNDLNEAERGKLTFVLTVENLPTQRVEIELRLLAGNQWGGFDANPELLAAYVMPNDAIVDKLKLDASRVLADNGCKDSLEGYQSADPRRVYMQAASVWNALVGQKLVYSNPPASFEISGQKTRSPQTMINDKLATCLDSSLLFASVLEGIGLNTIVIFVEGHCIAGFWLVDKTGEKLIENDPTEIRKAIAGKELSVFETTLITQRPSVLFDDAERAGQRVMRDDNDDQFIGAIDIRRARASGIRPLRSQLGQLSASKTNSAQQNDAAFPLVSDLPDFMPADDLQMTQTPATPEGRVDRWQRKLLDMSLRNRLLNYRDTKQSIPLLCPDISTLEDKLAERKTIRLISLEEHNPLGRRDKKLHFEQTGEDLDEQFAADSLRRNELAATLSGKELASRLTKLHRTVKNAIAEGGTNTLFLAVGFLKWKRSADEKKSYRAPLLLIPVKLERKSVLSEYKLKHHEDDVRFNSTLIQMLKRDFGRDMIQLESELPTDESGIDVSRVIRMVREYVRDIPGFEVVDDLALATFSFSKYLMWKDLVDRTDMLEQNRLVKHLIRDPDKVFQPGTDRPIPKPEDIDTKFTTHQLVHPLSADSSQLAAIMAANEGHDFVLIGPPGTGKSQTIANIIAQCLASRKTVLFVAEKTAALDVVYRRLRHHGLEDLCLELHSNKAERKKFLGQMQRSWDRRAQPFESRWIDINERLQIRRDQLNEYVSAIHTADSSGWTPFRAMGIIVKRKSEPSVELGWKGPADVTKTRFGQLKQTSEQLGIAFGNVEPSPALEMINVAQWSAAWEADLLRSIREFKTVLSEFKSILTDFARALGIDENQVPTLIQIDGLREVATMLIETASVSYRICYEKNIKKLKNEAVTFARHCRQLRADQRAMAAEYDLEQLEKIPIDELDLNWRKAKSNFWPFSWLGKWKTRNLLQSYVTQGDCDPERDLPLIRNMVSVRKKIQSVESLQQVPGFEGHATNLEKMLAFLDSAFKVKQTIRRFGDSHGALQEISKNLAPAIVGNDPNHRLVRLAQQYVNSEARFREQLNAFEQVCNSSITVQAGHPVISQIHHLLNELQNHRREFKVWTHWVDCRKKAIELGLDRLVEAVQAGVIAPARTAEAFELSFLRWWLPHAIDRSDILRKFQRHEHERLIEEFQTVDDEARTASSKFVIGQAAHGLPKSDEVPKNSELGLLRHQSRLKRPSKSIREVIAGMPNQFSRLAPCVLMSPLSIAQYLPADLQPFDVVIFDEASQITTWDAIGAIARGKQTIIVGDPKQLPPTNFFGQVDSDEDDETLADYEQDLESILDEVEASGVPVRTLDWHYRSRHESLIAFSNANYYQSKLVTFPSTHTHDQAVSFRYLADAVYDRGGTRTNHIEALAIVNRSVELMKGWLSLDEAERPTIGVITFNSTQQSLIQDLFDEELRKSPELEWYFHDDRIEPTVVKNLENVQGDERDYMLFSITYGPDQSKRASGEPGRSFGPLNKAGGERRLNVAITRARQQLIVFCSFLPDRLQIDGLKHQGPKDLKQFLHYAQRGPDVLTPNDSDDSQEYDSSLAQAVCDALTDRGWQVHSQVGVSSFRIDLGVAHPDKPTTFLAGIECDGATYRKSATARDRDKIRQQVLAGLGWNVIRVWSPDWWYDTAGAIEQLATRLEQLLADSRQATNPEIDEEPALVIRQQEDSSTSSGQGPDSPTVESADDDSQDAEYNAVDFYDSAYDDQLEQMVAQIIAQQAPIRIDLIAKQIARQHGWKRTGVRIRDRVAKFLNGYVWTEESTGTFLWPNSNVPRMMALRTNGSEFTDRSVDQICLAELCGFVDENHLLLESEPDPALALARMMNVNQLSKKARERIEEAIAAYNFANPDR